MPVSAQAARHRLSKRFNYPGDMVNHNTKAQINPQMIRDDGFFGYARTGELNGFKYPGLLRTGKEVDIESGLEKVTILGESVERKIVYPDFLKYDGSLKYFITDNIAVIPNGIELAQRASKLIERIWEVRAEVGYGKLIYVQGLSDPYLLPALIYAGVQLFDDSYPITEGLNGIGYTIFGKVKNQNGNIVEDNISFIEEELGLVSTAIQNGTLREVVEKFPISSKALEIMRILDRSYYDDVEKVFPVRTPYIKANGIESLGRPDLVRYREKLLEVYEKPQYAKVALVLPCSARKPYSSSRSHQAIISRITEFRKQVHEIIVTSPVGLVPRDLEEAYPARFYDIPVIGLWYEDEKKMMASLVKSYFIKNHYDKVISYIPEDLEFLADSLPENTVHISGGSSVDGNIEVLRSTLRSAMDEVERVKGLDKRLETYKSMAAFQFGNWITPYLDGTKIMNSYNQDMLVKKGDILLVYNKELGKFTINKHSAPFFLESGKYMVEIDNFKPTSNIYAVGILDSTDDVRPEDEVVLTYKGTVMGVGISKMPSDAMKELKKGVAVKVRN